MNVKKLFKQHNMSPALGGLINVYSATSILYSPLTLIGVATTLYGLWGGQLIQKWLPWFTIFHLIALMIVFILLAMGLFYKIVIPSTYAFQVQQQYKHRNPLVGDVRDISTALSDTNDKLDETNRKLDETNRELASLRKLILEKTVQPEDGR